MTEGEKDEAHRRAERLRQEVDEAVHGEERPPPRSPREFVAEQMRRHEREERRDDGTEEDGGEGERPGGSPPADG